MTEIQNKQEFIDATGSMGGSAFPFVAPAQTDKATGAILSVDIFPGMTLRDWYAGQFLAGAATANEPLAFRGNPSQDEVDAALRSHWDDVSRAAFIAADAFISARKAGA